MALLWPNLMCVCAFLLAWSSHALAKPGPDKAQAAPLNIQGPKTLLLGTDTGAQITLRTPEKPVKLFASVGSITQPVANEGRLSSHYTLPSTRFPQVALIVAVSDDLELIDFLVIQLLGQPQIRIHSEPVAQVRVNVAGVEFGPITLDHKGEGTIQIVVPPGVTTASIITSDRHGNERAKPRDLEVPRFQQLLAVCAKEGDGMLVVASDRQGNALANATLRLSASVGSLGRPKETHAGVYRASFTVGNDVEGNSAQLSARLGNTKDGVGTSCENPIPREAPSGLTISLDQDQFTAGSTTPIEVTLTLSYPGRRTPKDTVPDLRAKLGTLSSLKRISRTQFRTTWALPADFQGNSRADLSAEIAEGGVKYSAGVALKPGPLARLQIDSDRKRLRADHRKVAKLSIRGFDDFGNSAPVDTLEIVAKAGQVTLVSSKDGVAQARYVTPLRHESSSELVTVRSPSGKQASIAILLDPTPKRFMATARGGFATNFGSVSTMAFAVDASLRFAIFGHDVAVGLESGYFASDETRMQPAAVEAIALTLQVIPILVRVNYEFNTLPLPLYVGGGGGVLLATATIESERTGIQTQRSPTPTVSGLLGLRKQLGPGSLVMEASYWYSPFDEDGVTGNIGGLHLTGGYGMDF